MASSDFEIDMNDPVALMALFNAAESGADHAPMLETEVAAGSAPFSEPTHATPNPPPVAMGTAGDVARQASQATPPTPQAQSIPEPAGIATKDGQHIIPYSVLKADRDRANRAEQDARDLRQQLAALQALNQSGTGVNNGVPAAPSQSDQASAADQEELAQLKEDFPTVYKELMAMKQQVNAQQAQFKPVEERVRHAEQVQQQSIADQIQEAIDSTPKLAHIKATNPDAFELAQQFDNTLKDNPMWSGKPFAQRFAKVIELVEQMTGTIQLPNAGATSPAGKSAAQIKQEAMAIASAAVRANQSAVPTSLSEFPAGQNAVSDEQEALQNMTHAQLAQKFAKMTPDALETYLQNL